MKASVLFPLGVFAVLLVHGATLGLTDDEAYYWVLAQKPDWAYTYHPPAVAWIIALMEGAFGWMFRLFGAFPSELLVRLPAAATAGFVLWLALRWLRETGVPETRLSRAAWVIIAFAGYFGTSWMMVPDIPLFAGLMLLFYLTWRVCFPEGGRAAESAARLPGSTPGGASAPARVGARPSPWIYAGIAGAAALAMLSKYSAVLALGSAGLAVLLWAPRPVKWRAAGAIIAGGVIAAIPILIWNAQTGWGSILYQIRDRHSGGGLSWVRYGRFWVVQLLLAGPPLVIFGGNRLFDMQRAALWRRAAYQKVGYPLRYVLLWTVPPALVFLSQPLWADFKAHWTFVIWLPLAVEFGREAALGRLRRLANAQIAYGLSLTGIALLACQFPLVPAAASAFSTRKFDPRWDVTNDMYGWSGLRDFIREKGGEEALSYPVAGSRYQTAAQAAFAWGDAERAAKLPLAAREVWEWADLKVSDSRGPAWPRLKAPLLFVADNRYDAGPAFPGSDCRDLGERRTERGGYEAKRVRVWLCKPRPDAGKSGPTTGRK